MIQDFVLSISCRECGGKMGEIDQGELNHLMNSQSDGPICFSCEPIIASHRPEMFKGLIDGDVIDIDDTGFVVRDERLEFVVAPRASAHARGARACLSSSTYLNSLLRNRSVLSGMVEIKTCEECFGQGEVTMYSGIVPCDLCDGLGVRESAIVIPLWLLSGVVENA